MQTIEYQGFSVVIDQSINYNKIDCFSSNDHVIHIMCPLDISLEDILKKVDTFICNNLKSYHFEYSGYQVMVKNKSKNKNTYFKVNKEGSIIVTCPYHIKKNDIIKVLPEYIDKINNKIDIEKFVRVNYCQGGHIFYLGKKYTLNVIYSETTRVTINDSAIVFYLTNLEKDSIKYYVDLFMLEQSKKIFPDLFDKILANFEHIDFSVILKIKDMSSRFGCCYYKKGVVILSSMLLHYDIKCIEYVIIHELSHFIVNNHSKKFYYLVEQYCPNYRNIESILHSKSID